MDNYSENTVSVATQFSANFVSYDEHEWEDPAPHTQWHNITSYSKPSDPSDPESPVVNTLVFTRVGTRAFSTQVPVPEIPHPPTTTYSPSVLNSLQDSVYDDLDDDLDLNPTKTTRIVRQACKEILDATYDSELYAFKKIHQPFAHLDLGRMINLTSPIRPTTNQQISVTPPAKVPKSKAPRPPRKTSQKFIAPAPKSLRYSAPTPTAQRTVYKTKLWKLLRASRTNGNNSDALRRYNTIRSVYRLTRKQEDLIRKRDHDKRNPAIQQGGTVKSEPSFEFLRQVTLKCVEDPQLFTQEKTPLQAAFKETYGKEMCECAETHVKSAHALVTREKVEWTTIDTCCSFHDLCVCSSYILQICPQQGFFSDLFNLPSAAQSTLKSLTEVANNLTNQINNITAGVSKTATAVDLITVAVFNLNAIVSSNWNVSVMLSSVVSLATVAGYGPSTVLPLVTKYLCPTLQQSNDVSSTIVTLVTTCFIFILSIISKTFENVSPAILNYMGVIGRAAIGVTAVAKLVSLSWDWLVDHYHYYMFGRTKAEQKLIQILPAYEKWLEAIEFAETHITEKRLNTELEAIRFIDETMKLTRIVEPAIPKDSKLVSFFQCRLAKLTKLYLISLDSPLRITKNRQEPTSVYFAGKPGVGKSKLATMFARDILRKAHHDLLKTHDFQTLVYVRNAAKDHWDGFHEKVEVVWQDDFGQRVDSTNSPNPEIGETIQMHNCMPFEPPMAAITEKGKSPFRARHIIATSNTEVVRVKSITCPNALYRRRDFYYTVTVKDSVKNTNGGLDKNKLKYKCATCEQTYVGTTCQTVESGVQCTGTMFPIFDTSVYIFQPYDIKNGTAVHHKDASGNAISLTYRDVLAKYIRTYNDKTAAALVENKDLNRDSSDLATQVRHRSPFPSLSIAPLLSTTPSSQQINSDELSEVFDSVMDRIRSAPDEDTLDIIQNLDRAQLEINVANTITATPATDDDDEEVVEITAADAINLLNDLNPAPEPTAQPQSTISKYIQCIRDKYSNNYVVLATIIGLALFAIYYKWKSSTSCCIKTLDVSPASLGKCTCEKCAKVLSFEKDLRNQYLSDTEIECRLVQYIGSAFGVDNSKALAEVTARLQAQSGDQVTRQRKAPQKLSAGQTSLPLSQPSRPAIQQQGMNTNTVDIAFKVAYNSQYVISSGVKFINTIFVKNDIILVQEHFLKSVREQPEGRFSIIDTHNGATIFVGYLSQTPSAVVKSTLYGELKLLKLGRNCPRRCDITKHFISNSDINLIFQNSGKMSIVQQVNDRFAHSFQEIPNYEYTLKNWTLENGEKYVECLRYKAATSPGSCGSVLFTNSKRSTGKIIGVHGASNGVSSYGFLLTREHIEQAIAELSAEDDETPAVIHGGEFIDQTQAPMEHCAGRVGVLRQRINANTKTQVAPSLIHDSTQTTTAPAQLRPFHYNGRLIDPLQQQFSKYCRPKLQLKDHLTNSSYDSILQMHVNIFNSQDVNRNFRVLTSEEAIVGTEEFPYLRPLCRKTSPGFPWVLSRKGKGKSQFLGADEFAIDASTYNLLDEMERTLHTSKSVFIATLKDERRPIEKVKTGKTRIFTVGNFLVNILLRKYFGAFLDFLVTFRIENESGVGMNVFSEDALYLHMHLTRHGPYCIDGDYSEFDGRQPFEYHLLFAKLANHFYATSPDHHPDHDLARIQLIKDVCCPYIIIDNEVYALTGVNTSGNALTTHLNNFVNQMAVRYCYNLLAEFQPRPPGPYHENVSLICYGDDNVLNISPDVISWFNQLTITEAMAEQNFIYTSANKEDALVPYRTLDQITFLKRRFTRVQDRIHLALDPKVIKEMVFWVRAPESPKHNYQLTLDNCDTALLESTLHGEEFYDDFAKFLSRAWARTPYTVAIQHFQTNYNRLLTYGADMRGAVQEMGDVPQGARALPSSDEEEEQPSSESEEEEEQDASSAEPFSPPYCPVCRVPFNLSHPPRTTPCNHTFCSQCTTNMFESNDVRCPLCRTEDAMYPDNPISQTFVRCVVCGSYDPNYFECHLSNDGEYSAHNHECTLGETFRFPLCVSCHAGLEHCPAPANECVRCGEPTRNRVDVHPDGTIHVPRAHHRICTAGRTNQNTTPKIMCPRCESTQLRCCTHRGCTPETCLDTPLPVIIPYNDLTPPIPRTPQVDPPTLPNPTINEHLLEPYLRGRSTRMITGYLELLLKYLASFKSTEGPHKELSRLVLPIYCYSKGIISLKECILSLHSKYSMRFIMLMSALTACPQISLSVFFFVICEEGIKALPEFFGPAGFAISIIVSSGFLLSAAIGDIYGSMALLLLGAVSWVVCATAHAIGYTPTFEDRRFARITSVYFGVVEFITYLAYAPSISLSFVAHRFLPLLLHKLRPSGLFSGTIEHFYWNMMAYTGNSFAIGIQTSRLLSRYRSFSNLSDDLAESFEYVLSKCRTFLDVVCALPRLTVNAIKAVLIWAKTFAQNSKRYVILLLQKLVQILKKVLLYLRNPRFPAAAAIQPTGTASD